MKTKKLESVACRVVPSEGLVDCSAMFAEEDEKRMKYLNAIIKFNDLLDIIKRCKRWPGYQDRLDKAETEMSKVLEVFQELNIAVDEDLLA